MAKRTDGPPCRAMEHLLQGTADGSLKGIPLWFAVLHASRCVPCGNYVMRIRETVQALRHTKDEVSHEDAIKRLAALIPVEAPRSH